MDIRMVIMDDKLLVNKLEDNELRKIRHHAGFYHVQYPSGHCHRDTNAEDTVKRKTVLELKKENVL